MAVPEREGFAEVDGGGRLFFETRGEGHAVVLLHAGIADRRMWAAQFAGYAGRYQVVRYDVRGFGRSDAPKAPYSDAEDLSALLRALDLDRVSLVGSSNGGRIALDFALTHPTMVEALVAAAPGLVGYEISDDPEERAAFDELEQEQVAAREVARTVGLEAGIDRLIALWARAVPEAARPAVFEMMRDNARRVFDDDRDFAIGLDPPTVKQLPQLRVPTLVVEGELDHPAMHYLADAVANGVPGSQRTTIEGADHLINLSRPEAFDRAVLDFLA
ncbi:MAG: alpha/beta fold hydrolase [Thermoplasmata archaeon]